jgi:hypothetical protein
MDGSAQLRSRGGRRTMGVLAAATIAASAQCALAQGTTLGFNFADFSMPTGLTLVGGASTPMTTAVITPPTRALAGAMWYTDTQVPLGLGWETIFTYSVSDIAGIGADGFALVLQNEAPNAIGGTGGAMGYADNLIFGGDGGITNSIAIEFDLWDNTGQWNDFNSSNHISIQSRGMLANSPAESDSLAATMLNPVSRNLNGMHQVRVTYDGALTTLEVFLDADVVPVLSANVDIDAIMSLSGGNDGWIGFTAGTGAMQNVQRHEILDWSFTGVVPSPGSGGLMLSASLLLAARRRRNTIPTSGAGD